MFVSPPEPSLRGRNVRLQDASFEGAVGSAKTPSVALLDPTAKTGD